MVDTVFKGDLGFVPNTTPPVVATSGGATRLLRRKVALFGDSRVFLSHSGGGKNSMIKGFGPAHWTQAFSKGLVEFPAALNFGVAGNTTTQMLDRIDAAITAIKAANCDLVVFIGGTNNFPAGIDFGITKGEIVEIVRKFSDNAISVVAISEMPRGAPNALSSDKNDQLLALHDYYETEISKMCKVVNVWDRFVDPASLVRAPLADLMQPDRLHQAIRGAAVMGEELAKAIVPMVPGKSLLFHSNIAYDASSNRYGSLSPNPFMLGTGGSIAGNTNPVAGSVLPASWTVDASNWAGLSTTFSQEVDDKGVTWLVVKITGTPTATSSPELAIASKLDATKLAVGDKVKAIARVKSEGTGLTCVGTSVLATPGYYQLLDADEYDNTMLWPSQPIDVTRETPVYTHESSQTDIFCRLLVNCQKGTAVNATIKFTRAGALKLI